VGFNWNEYLFADQVLPMGLRSSAQICQRIITTSITFMYFKLMVNYLDDFGELRQKKKPGKEIEVLLKMIFSFLTKILPAAKFLPLCLV
jgi:hypothetical protein